MKKLDLRRVTAICIDARPDDHLDIGLGARERYKLIISFMQKFIDFGEIKIIGNFKFEAPGVKFISHDTMTHKEYSKFCLYQLHNYINTDYCLIFQDDGFPVNPHLWDNLFFNYDYIGTPWPERLFIDAQSNPVGGGGFSLRSKKYLKYCSTLPFHHGENEDSFVMRTHRNQAIKDGIKIAPLDVARRFAVEEPLDESHNMHRCFGFHGRHHGLEKAEALISEKLNSTTYNPTPEIVRLKLPTVTAVCIEGRSKEGIKEYGIEVRYKKILRYLKERIEFAEIVFISPFDIKIEGIRYYKIDPVSYEDYNKFIIYSLSDYINTEHCLTIQDDGYPLNPEFWAEKFLDYDYIGCPWPNDANGIPGTKVGSGGFSLRSKKLLEWGKTLEWINGGNEDYLLTVNNRQKLLKTDLKIGTLEIAKQFGVENKLDELHTLGTCFGFHGRIQNLEESDKILNQRLGV